MKAHGTAHPGTGHAVRRRWTGLPAWLVQRVSAVFMLLTFPKRWLAVLLIAVMACVLVWLWQRPETMPEAGRPPS